MLSDNLSLLRARLGEPSPRCRTSWPAAVLVCILTLTTFGQTGQQPPSATAATKDKARSSPTPITPRLSHKQKELLSRVARRTLSDYLLGRGEYEPGYVPTALKKLEAEVVVRLRQDGYLREAGVGGPLPVAIATRNATLAAIKPLGAKLHDAQKQRFADRLLVEIEVVGEAVPIVFDGDWTDPHAISPFVEPGLDGIVFLSAGLQKRIAPSEVFTNDVIVTDALQTMAQQILNTKKKVADVRLLRFRTSHWYEPRADAPIVPLQRGLTIVPQGAVNPKSLDHAIERLAEYMCYRQKPSGLFSYQYACGRDVFAMEDNLVRQAGTIAALADYAHWTGGKSSAARAAADLGIRRLLDWKTLVADPPDIAYLATPGGKNKLGVTALATIALVEHPERDKYQSVREQFINAMLYLQRPSGMFATAFPPAQDFSTQDYFPGEALLAMAMHYQQQPEARVMAAFDRAIDFYRLRFRHKPSPAFVPWQVQAYTIMARQAKRGDYRNYVFELTDWLADKQLTPANCEYPEMWGGIAAYMPGRAGIDTAAYLEAFTDALSLAREVGDQERAARYQRLVELATRFVMQLQFRPEEAYFVKSPRNAVWGLRSTPTLDLMRIDHCQHGLVGFMKARDVLFPRD